MPTFCTQRARGLAREIDPSGAPSDRARQPIPHFRRDVAGRRCRRLLGDARATGRQKRLTIAAMVDQRFEKKKNPRFAVGRSPPV